MKVIFENTALENRERILQRENLVLIRIFDTNEHELHKDVVLVEDAMGRQLVLRIGEHRTLGFFHGGYRGKYFVIPKLYKVSNDFDVPYEIEEHLPGKLLCEIAPIILVSQIFPQEILIKLVQAFWEFQVVTEKLTFLKASWSKKDHLLKFFQKAQNLLNKETLKSVETIIQGEQWDEFWKPGYPCKWKYSADNLIYMPNGRLGLIDLAKVSKRFWGYDLGWIFWPCWHHFRDEDYQKATEHFSHLSSFFDLVYSEAPQRFKEEKESFFTRCHIIVLERCIGALYDIVVKKGHIASNLKTERQRLAYVLFVKNILKRTLQKLNH